MDVIAHDDRVEAVWPRYVTADDQRLPTIHAVFDPRAGAFPWLIKDLVWVCSSGMHKNKVTCAQDAPDSCRYSVSIRNGGPGQVRTGDLEFRKLSLYPSELQALKH